jgi:hypothetical protein
MHCSAACCHSLVHASAANIADLCALGCAQGLEEKRVRNAKVREQLGVGLRFPSYREGLRAIHEGHIEPFLPGDLKWLLQG